MKSAILVTVLCMGLSGCFPTVATVDPGWGFVVVGPDRAPVAGATVTVNRWGYPYGMPAGQSVAITDAAGQAKFRPRSRIEMWMLIPGHGPTVNHWSWCASAPGYAEAVSKEVWRPKAVKSPIEVALTPGEPKAGLCQDTSALKAARATR